MMAYGEKKPMLYVMSGYNQRAVIAFLRYLKKIKYDDYSIIAANADDMILKTVYKSHVVYIRKIGRLSIEEFEDIFANNTREGIFMPSTEALVRFQIENRDLFEKHGITIPVVEKKLYETLSDKHKFWEICKGYGLTVPKIYSDTDEVKFPLVIKPKAYMLSTNEVISPHITYTEEDLRLFLEKCCKNEFDFQEYIDGESYYLLYYIAKNGEMHVFSQQNILQQPNGKSMVAAVPSHIHEERICKEYGRMLKEIGFYGLVMVELRKQGDNYYMIEANPRMWGPSQLLVDAGVEFFGYLLNDYGAKIKIENKTPNYNVRYFWSGGIKGTLKKHVTYDVDLRMFEKYDVYNRNDTLEIYRLEGEKMDKIIAKMQKLYADESKHSQYQQLPSCLVGKIDADSIKTGAKYEKERFDYIVDNIKLGERVMDIGGNSGFFTLESISSGVKEVDYWEGNKVHAEFVQLASRLVGYENKIIIHNEFFDFGEDFDKHFDTIFLLNVIHHLGIDFEDGIDLEKAKNEMIKCINRMAHVGSRMVLQMGFNWGGDVNKPIFEKGLKKEMIDFIESGTRGNWSIEKVGIAVKKEGVFVYEDVTNENILRVDEYGEFLNRPIFILSSLV